LLAQPSLVSDIIHRRGFEAFFTKEARPASIIRRMVIVVFIAKPAGSSGAAKRSSRFPIGPCGRESCNIYYSFSGDPKRNRRLHLSR
jgi:hypothetical protein